MLGCAFALSFLLNVVAAIVLLVMCVALVSRGGLTDDGLTSVPEKHFSGSRSATNKIAIVSLDGVIMEGLLGNVHRQLEQAAKDDSVKAVVLRINSPGGSITASDDLHRRIIKLRDGEKNKDRPAKPLVVSMSSVAASGGYYVAVPASRILAERSTLTGSIGVYTSLPNVKELASKVGVSMNTIKAGAIKDSGSMFKEMTPSEQQVLQDMVDDAYIQFLTVVEKGRPKLTRARMLERFQVQPLRPDPKNLPPGTSDKPYTRYRADGGVWTAVKARELGLIDAVGTVEDAVTAAAEAAELDEDSFKAIRYQKRPTLTDILLSGKSSPPPSASLLELPRLRAAFTPRLWYLAPGHEAVGLLAAAEQAP
jgi:protease-4